MACRYQLGSRACTDRFRLRKQAGSKRCLTEHLSRADALLTQIADRRRALLLAQLLSVQIAYQRVVVEGRPLDRAEHSCESQLATSRLQQVFSSHDEIHAVAHVIDGDRELIAPVPVPVAQQQIPALVPRFLPLRAQ